MRRVGQSLVDDPVSVAYPFTGVSGLGRMIQRSPHKESERHRRGDAVVFKKLLPLSGSVDAASSCARDQSVAHESVPRGPTLLPSARRSGCSSAEPYSPNRPDHRRGLVGAQQDPLGWPSQRRPRPFELPQCAKQQGLGWSPNENECAPSALL